MCDALEGIAGVVEVAFYERIQLFGVIGRAALICAARALRPGQSGLYINVRECRAFDVPVFQLPNRNRSRVLAQRGDTHFVPNTSTTLI